MEDLFTETPAIHALVTNQNNINNLRYVARMLSIYILPLIYDNSNQINSFLADMLSLNIYITVTHNLVYIYRIIYTMIFCFC